MAVSNPNLIFYVCVSKGTTILAEFNSKDADLATLAYKCLHKTPPLHVTFSHTVRNRTHTFLIDNPIIYFAIYDEKLENSEVLIFLTNVKQAFDKMIVIDDVITIQNLNSHRFQGEFNPVFHQLLASQEDLEGGPNSPPMEIIDIRQSDSLDSPRGKRIGSVPLLGGGGGEVSKSLKKKKKKRFSDESSSSNGGSKDRSGSGNGGILSREISMSMTAANGFFGGVGESPRHGARRVWKRHVWVVLSLDLIVCCVLFGVWLWICRGFKCIDG